MNKNIRVVSVRRRAERRGVAAVETAVVLPLLVVLILGVVDMGQFANCHQKVSDASREGARFAARYETTNVPDVEAAVLACLGDMFPTVPAETLQQATTVTVRDAAGQSILGDGLGAVPSGNLVEVEVTLQFNAVRWISGLQILGGRIVQASTDMRRE